MTYPVQCPPVSREIIPGTTASLRAGIERSQCSCDMYKETGVEPGYVVAPGMGSPCDGLTGTALQMCLHLVHGR
jgi:hypothetical protein